MDTEQGKSQQIVLGMPAKMYHALERVSSSKLRMLRESVRKYHAVHIAKTMPSKASDAMRLGTLLHDMLLLPANEWLHRWELEPQCDRRSAAGKAEWAALAEKCRLSDSEPFSQEMGEKALDMAESIRGTPPGEMLFKAPDRNKTERVIVWPQPSFDAEGVPVLVDCKAMLDMTIEAPEQIEQYGSAPVDLIVDLKTTSGGVDPRNWSYTVSKYGYHMQAAWYCDAHHAATGRAAQFLFVAVNTSPPYEVGFHQLPPVALNEGRLLNEQMLLEYVRRMHTDDWLPLHSRQIVATDLPKSAYYTKDDWSLTDVEQ